MADTNGDDHMQVDESGPSMKRKGRGFKSGGDRTDDILDKNATYDRLEDPAASDTAGKAARSVEGWIVVVTNVHEEATEEDLTDKFSEYGHIQNLHLNLDRRTGYVKGYAFVEYETRREAEAAIAGASGTQLLEQTLQCDFAIIRPPTGAAKGAGGGAAKQGGGRRGASPDRSLASRIGS